MRFAKMEVGRDWNWITQRANCALCEDSKGVVALRDHRPVAAVVADSWTYTACTAHVVVEDALAIKAGFIDEVMRWIFEDCGRRIIVGVIPSTNAACLRFVKKLGFEILYRIKDGYDNGIDLIVHRLDKEKWVPIVSKRNGQEIRRTACA